VATSCLHVALPISSFDFPSPPAVDHIVSSLSSAPLRMASLPREQEPSLNGPLLNLFPSTPPSPTFPQNALQNAPTEPFTPKSGFVQSLSLCAQGVGARARGSQHFFFFPTFSPAETVFLPLSAPPLASCSPSPPTFCGPLDSCRQTLAC